MNLEEFRQALSSEATEKAKKQEKIIKDLKRQIKTKDDERAVVMLKKDISRQFEAGMGGDCSICRRKEYCSKRCKEHQRLIDLEIAKAFAESIAGQEFCVIRTILGSGRY